MANQSPNPLVALVHVLRGEGKTVAEIAAQLEVMELTVRLWLRELPLS